MQLHTVLEVSGLANNITIQLFNYNIIKNNITTIT